MSEPQRGKERQPLFRHHQLQVKRWQVEMSRLRSTEGWALMFAPASATNNGHKRTERISNLQKKCCFIGPGEAILLPSFLEEYEFENCRTDHEAELAIIIKDRIKNVEAARAMDHVLGFSCFNDVSQRNLQRSDKSGWYRGKSLDTFGPIGPVIVTPEAIGDPQCLDICCRLNGKVVQQSNTKHMIFKIPEIIAFVSRNFTMEPGDIIITGTPSGVGPLRDGDLVEVEIEGIGTLSNPVRNE